MIALVATLTLAQTVAASSPPQSKPPQAPPSDDIVVSGLRDIDEADSAVTSATLGSSSTGNSVRSRVSFEAATRLARCAIQDTPDFALLRTVLDSRTNSAKQDFFQVRVAETNTSCLPAIGMKSAGGTYYDRGALYIEAIKAFAPTFKLSKAQTSDPIVQQRFNAREIPLAKFRLAQDRQYFETAICFARLQPELALRLVRTDRPSDIKRIEAAIVNRTRVCVGGAKKVYFDGAQFRFYIADATYRWIVAAQGVDSLIPAG